MSSPNPHQEVLIVTGMSGAGRSTVANALEDLGWYVVDNLPPQMLRPLAELADKASDTLPKIAAVVDVRGGDLFQDIQHVIKDLRMGSQVRVVFLEATDDVLVRRFEAVRRPHPLQGEGTLLDGIAEERNRLRELRASSDVVIDTSRLNIHQLATATHDIFATNDDPALQLTVMSFGFKYGIPTDVDLVADMRFLPNPYWVPELRSLTGANEEVKEFVLSREGAAEFIEKYSEALVPVFAGYQRENKRHATVAVGCTGGKHRSVAVARELANRFQSLPGVVVHVKHRDLGRE
ncbi:RNase adapter RapZ [Lysinibacter sp. HNR]|uniref:RNase adapter RapZ n=1 Tax=Lysinibacter sp. HNR TaxID=3031408 RepID=UPI0024360423|nr:RNase adapter RapZ [Lysinibacter sp. HNR]WGD36179.1 RNase adapter RapZ [Lysinibacter sp. HNR]